MPRPRGVRNPNDERRRRELLETMARRLVASDSAHAGVRELAACSVSLPTLRHYFGGREDMLRAIFEEQGRQGAEHMERCATPTRPVAESIPEVLRATMSGLRHGRLSEVFAIGLAEDIRHGAVGPAWVERISKPMLAAFRRRLDVHVERGEMRACDTRSAAITLVAPVILAGLHRKDLGGAAVHPLDRDGFVAAHAEGFVRGHAARVGGGAA